MYVYKYMDTKYITHIKPLSHTCITLGREFAIPKPFSILNPRSDLHLDKSLNIVIFLVNINADGINRIYTY